MAQALPKPSKKNPVARTRQPSVPPTPRSRQAMGLTAAAAAGRFDLQVCQECDTVQYPAREVCGNCLSEHLKWQPVKPIGRLLAVTTLHHSNEVYFRERLPWRVGTVQLDAGPSAIVHVHADCTEGQTVRLALKLDRSGQAVMIALPEKATPHLEDDKTLRETSCDPKYRRVLITDGKTAVGLATARALLDAGATDVYIGDPTVWIKSAEFNALCEDPRVHALTLSVIDSSSVHRVSRTIGGKVDILINTADYQRDGGILHNGDVTKAVDTFDTNCIGLMRLAQHFGGAMAGRTADGVNNAVAWVNILSIYAHVSLPARGIWSASQAAALSISQSLRSEFRPAGIRVVNVFTGPIAHEWEQLTPPPRVAPQIIARSIVRALQEGTEDVYVGDIAQEFLARLQDNPKALERELGN